MHSLLGKAALLTGLGLLAATSSAGASITIGQTGIPPAPPAVCAGNIDRVQGRVSSGNSYTVPSTVATGTITSWSTQGRDIAGDQFLALKVFRPVGGATYTAVGHEGPRTLNRGILNTFPASVPVKAGDVLGNNVPPSGGMPVVGCYFPAIGDNYLAFTGSLADGQSGDFTTSFEDRRLNVSAVIEPTNTFTIGRTTRNRKKGTAIVTVNVPNPGSLTASGNGVKSAGAGAVISKDVAAPGAAKLTIRAKGKKRKTLNQTGKVKLKPKINYTPTGGIASTRATKLKLKKQ